MANTIFLIDPVTRETKPFERVTFSAVGIHERSDLQEWILGHPEILGEQLLFITSEFAGFDKSSRRLDILALDEDGVLVVIELKLDAKHELADLQMLRYAAFCSTMTMDQVVGEYSRFNKCSDDDARSRIPEFLGAGDELPELGDRPRMMLVAGSLDNVELTSTVLWLRDFQLDVTCLEVTPYQIPGQGILLVPQTIIPLPEVEEYQVRVAEKEAERVRKQREPGPYQRLWDRIRERFQEYNAPFQPSRNPQRSYFQIPTGLGGFHYEWMVSKKKGTFHVEFHFEGPQAARDFELAELLAGHEKEISNGVARPFHSGPWTKRWASAGFLIPLDEGLSEGEMAAEAAELMATLIERTWPVLENELTTQYPAAGPGR